METHGLLRSGDRVLLAVSGGVDSMVLFDLFLQFRSELALTLGVVHVNHQLRGDESDEDERFVAAAAHSEEIPFFSTRVNVKEYQRARKLSKQEAARDLRYAFFEEVRVRDGWDHVATAHQANDNAETVFINALRGAGVRGLSGIPIRRETGAVIRPLLFARRGEIEMYANERHIAYREDASNRSPLSRRNQIRHSVLPLLDAELGTDAVESLNRVSSLMRSLGGLLKTEVSRALPDIVSTEGNSTRISLSALSSLPLFLREEIILSVFRSIGIEPTAQKVQACMELGDHPTGKSLDLSAHWSLLHDRGVLILYPKEGVPEVYHDVAIGGTYDLGTFRFSARALNEVPHNFGGPPGVQAVDGGRLGKLVLRSWHEGDWFIPLGMSGRKKLSDFFVDARVPRSAKHAIPVLESDGTIVWICGMRVDQRFSIGPATRQAVELRYEQLSPHS